MFTPELLEEIRQVLSKVRVARRLVVSEVAARMSAPAFEIDAMLVGRVGISDETGREMARALGVEWSDVIAVAKQRWDHNRLYGEAIQRLADHGAVTDPIGG